MQMTCHVEATTSPLEQKNNTDHKQKHKEMQDSINSNSMEKAYCWETDRR